MHLFYSDLDNTMIYSYKHNLGIDRVCVELYKGEKQSFMTKSASDKLNQIVNDMNNIIFVPVTTRTIEQYNRINLPVGEIDYALVCNGGILLKNGVIDEKWYEESLRLVGAAKTQLELAERILNEDENRTLDVRNISGLFVFTKSSKPEEIKEKLENELDLSMVSVHLNGVKVYVVPHKLDKGNAVIRFSEYYKGISNSRITTVAAGDSDFDIPMLRSVDIAIAPAYLGDNLKLDKASKREIFLIENDVITDEILDIIKKFEKN